MSVATKEVYFIEVYLDSSDKFGDEHLNSGVFLFIQKNKINNEELLWKKNEMVAYLNNSVKDHILRKYMILKYKICLIKNKEIHMLISNLDKKYDVNEIGDSLETNELKDINSLKKYKPYGQVISNRSSGRGRGRRRGRGIGRGLGRGIGRGKSNVVIRDNKQEVSFNMTSFTDFPALK